MIAATFTQGGQLKFKDLPAPTVGDGELLVRVDGSALCGTDVKITRHGHRKLKKGQTIVLGHEFVGTIAEKGTRVSGNYAVGQRVGVAVSGGADSVFLLHALVRMRAEFGLEVVVLHLNHGLRGAESDGDEEFVRALITRPLPKSLSQGEGLKEALPLRIVFHDYAFANDTAKENVRQLLKQLSAETEMRVV